MVAVVDFEFIDGRVRGLGGEGVQPGDGGPWAIAGTSLSGGRAGQIRMVSPGGRHRGVWGTLSSTLAPEGRVVLTT